MQSSLHLFARIFSNFSAWSSVLGSIGCALHAIPTRRLCSVRSATQLVCRFAFVPSYIHPYVNCVYSSISLAIPSTSCISPLISFHICHSTAIITAVHIPFSTTPLSHSTQPKLHCVILAYIRSVRLLHHVFLSTFASDRVCVSGAVPRCEVPAMYIVIHFVLSATS